MPNRPRTYRVSDEVESDIYNADDLAECMRDEFTALGHQTTHAHIDALIHRLNRGEVLTFDRGISVQMIDDGLDPYDPHEDPLERDPYRWEL